MEIVTQAPLVGWVLAAARADEDPEVTADGTLAGTTQPAYYLAICGAEPSGIGGLDLVAAPPEPLGRVVAERLEAARARAAELEGRVADLESALTRAQQELGGRDAEPDGARGQPAAPAGADSGHASLLMRLAEADARLAELEVDVGGE